MKLSFEKILENFRGAPPPVFALSPSLPEATVENHAVGIAFPPCLSGHCYHDSGSWCCYREWKRTGLRLRIEDAQGACPMVYDDRPPVPASTKALKEPADNSQTCRACGGADFWLSVHGKQICRRCHPPAGGNLIADGS